MAALIPLFGCAPSGPQAPTVTLRLSPTPATVGGTRLLLDVSDSTGAALSGARVQLNGRPKDATSPTIGVVAIESEAGRYVVESFDFSEPGVWTIDVVVTTDSNVTSRVSRDVRVVGGAPS